MNGWHSSSRRRHDAAGDTSATQWNEEWHCGGDGGGGGWWQLPRRESRYLLDAVELSCRCRGPLTARLCVVVKVPHCTITTTQARQSPFAPFSPHTQRRVKNRQRNVHSVSFLPQTRPAQSVPGTPVLGLAASTTLTHRRDCHSYSHSQPPSPPSSSSQPAAYHIPHITLLSSPQPVSVHVLVSQPLQVARPPPPPFECALAEQDTRY